MESTVGKGEYKRLSLHQLKLKWIEIDPLCRFIFSAPLLRQRNLSHPLTLKAPARKSHKIQSQAKPTKVLNPQSTSRPDRPHPNTHKRPKPNPTLQIPTSDAFFYFRPKNSQISHHKPIPSSSKNLPSPNRFTSQSFPRQLPHSRESRNLVHEHHIQIVAPTILFFNFFSIVCISIETQNKKYVDRSQSFFYFVPQQSRRQAGLTMPVSSFLTSNIEATAQNSSANDLNVCDVKQRRSIFKTLVYWWAHV